MAECRKLLSWDTDYSADSAEFCPIEEFTHFMAIGTYQLIKDEVNESSEENKRIGKLYLKELTNDKKILLHQTIELSAILDMKWNRHLINNQPVLAVALSCGEVQIFKLVKNENNAILEHIKSCPIGDALALSIDWSNGKFQSEPKLVVTDSKGRVSIINVFETESIVASFKAHDYEAWIGAYNYWTPNVLYTGGDDTLFKGFDTRSSDVVPIFTNKSHMSGVTSIQTSLHYENYLANGSYDEYVNLWDFRHMKNPLHSLNLGGGIWRIKWEPSGLPFILIAGMHSGFHIINIKDIPQMKLHGSFLDHGSLAYGCDWSHKNLDSSKSTIVSVSFYDHLLCLWEFDHV